MFKREAGRADLIWGYLAQGLNIGAGLLILPVILVCWSSEDVGLWLVFITIASLTQLLEFGFQPTIVRNLVYVYSGSQSLNHCGMPGNDNVVDKCINYRLLFVLTAAARRIYLYIAVIASFGLVIIAPFYLGSVIGEGQNIKFVLIAWMLLSAGNIVGLYWGYLNGLLMGRGDYKEANKAIVITKSSFVVLGAASVALGFGIVGLSAVFFASSVFGRFAANYFYKAKRTVLPERLDLDRKEVSELLKVLWPNASRYGLVQLGAFLIQKGNILLATSALGLKVAASYGLTITILMAIASISLVPAQIQSPHMTKLQVEGDRRSLANLYGLSLALALIFCLLISLSLLFFGNYILRIIGSATELLSFSQLLVLMFVILLEVQHGVAALYLMTKNQVPFTAAALYSGSAVLLLGLITVGYFGVWGLILSQMMVQLIYNNWKWPVEAAKDLGLKHTSIFLSGCKKLVLLAKGT